MDTRKRVRGDKTGTRWSERRSPSMKALMKHWANQKAEALLDEFIANESSDDLLKLHKAIVQALYQAYEMGQKECLAKEQ